MRGIIKLDNEKSIIEAMRSDLLETSGSASLKTQDITNAIVEYLLTSDPSSEFMQLLQEYRKQLFRNVECSSSQLFAQRIQAAEKRKEGIYFLEDSWGKLLKEWLDENPAEAPVVKALDDIYCILPPEKPTKKWISKLNEIFTEFSEVRVLNVVRSQITLLIESGDILKKGICKENERKLKLIAFILTVKKYEVDADILRKLALLCYTKIPCAGPISTGAGNVCLQGLSDLDGKQGLVHLCELTRKITYPANAVSFAKKRLAEAAHEKGLSIQDLESIIVPDYGLKD